VRPLIEEAVKAIPPPKDGAPGKDGTSVTIEDVLPIIHEAVKSIPAPKDGADGKDGEPGKDGSSVVLDDVLPALREDVQKAIEALPVPKDGRDGKDGNDGKSVTVEDFRQMFEAEQAKWALDFERRANDLLQRTFENMPKPKDGKDGLGFDDLAVEDDGEGNVTLKFQRGEAVKEFNLHFPCFKYRGVWTEQSYREGDGVTFGGSLWLAKKESPEGKPGQSDDWQLAVKKGRDGKDGKDGVMVEQPTKPVIKVPPR
jgi:hypothetical protein